MVQVDPLTFCGLHYGLQGAKAAAETVISAFQVGDISSVALKDYQRKVDGLFGWDFWM